MMALKMESYWQNTQNVDVSSFKINLPCDGIPLKCQPYYLMKPDDFKVQIKTNQNRKPIFCVSKIRGK